MDLMIHCAGTWAAWAPRWCATTSLVSWTSSASCAASTPKWCRPSGRGWRTGSQSASTNSATTAGIATPQPGITTCSDACCYEVSRGSASTGRGHLSPPYFKLMEVLKIIILENVGQQGGTIFNIVDLKLNFHVQQASCLLKCPWAIHWASLSSKATVLE